MAANTPNTPDSPDAPKTPDNENARRGAPPPAAVTAPPPGALPLAWLGLAASIAWVLKSANPTWGVGVLCLCAGLISSFGARRRGRAPWPAFFTGLLPVGVALFFALLMLRPLLR
ncbi:hypothetical protein [Pandoraea pulmonicola]|uniref:Uncharacterized protein n=1 Tax=Pandoraea pulmonicola TaxID=93221 RepID=A0AAJ4ZGW8_PANPU|nr:hypothetical protein [Pandoraea pulmonicola]AJC22674.1 hypothetical protein RO07_23380 [Pandoraea pulmonicola]SUA93093.1 Uncharacterised protein [Pandoraea pulmonicola]